MPTGLTYVVVDEPSCSFEKFVLRCARQMGPCGWQRDEPSSVPPRLPSPRDVERYRVEIELLETKLAEAKALSLEQAAVDAAQFRDKLLAQHTEMALGRAKARGRVRAMLDRVEMWPEPTPDHVALKKLMMEQLRETYEEYADQPEDLPKLHAPEEWKQVHIDWYADDLERTRKRLAEMEVGFARRSAWISALYKSLGMTAPAHDEFRPNPFKKNTTGEP